MAGDGIFPGPTQSRDTASQILSGFWTCSLYIIDTLTLLGTWFTKIVSILHVLALLFWWFNLKNKSCFVWMISNVSNFPFVAVTFKEPFKATRTWDNVFSQESHRVNPLTHLKLIFVLVWSGRLTSFLNVCIQSPQLPCGKVCEMRLVPLLEVNCPQMSFRFNSSIISLGITADSLHTLTLSCLDSQCIHVSHREQHGRCFYSGIRSNIDDKLRNLFTVTDYSLTPSWLKDTFIV